MKGKSIGLIVAMPEEVRPIARRLGPGQTVRIGRFPCHRFRLEGREIFLVRSGMGRERAAAATTALIAAHRPDVLISAGFGGGVRKGPKTGDVVLADQVLSLSDEKITGAMHIETGDLLRGIMEALPSRVFRILNGCVITSRGILRKKEADRILPAELSNPVLDMETSAVAEAAARESIPFLALRAISDPAEEEILFSIEEITDRELNISIRRVLSTILRKPRILPQMIRLARNAKKAGSSLALVLERIILTA
jgi:adenosylhomocysteine nucleosidase